MKYKLLEDNKSIIKDIEHLDKLIVELRTTNELIINTIITVSSLLNTK
jgi:hypothetical protein